MQVKDLGIPFQLDLPHANSLVFKQSTNCVGGGWWRGERAPLRHPGRGQIITVGFLTFTPSWPQALETAHKNLKSIE